MGEEELVGDLLHDPLDLLDPGEINIIDMIIPMHMVVIVKMLRNSRAIAVSKKKRALIVTIPTNTSVTLETLDSQTTRLQDDSWKSGELLIFYTFQGLYVKVGMQALKLNRIF